jgi:molybdopterin synthase catalytic subunit
MNPLSTLNRHLILTREPIDEIALIRQRQLSAEAGAVVCFLGIVRGTEQDQPIRSLEYEAFPQMVEHEFSAIFDRMADRWPIQSVRVVHRLGIVPVGEPSLWVEVISPHRAEAFAACQFLIDEMKRVVPIWKKPLA